MECKYFEDATIFDCDFNEIEYKYCMLFDDECKKARRKKDCPYRLHKQLKRKEQENAELKEKIIKLSEEKGHLIIKNNTLEEANQSLSVLGTDLASANEIVRKEFFRADKNKDMWREKAENLQKTLQEIKEIAEDGTKTEDYLLGQRYTDLIDRILDLITKAEEE